VWTWTRHSKFISLLCYLSIDHPLLLHILLAYQKLIAVICYFCEITLAAHYSKMACSQCGDVSMADLKATVDALTATIQLLVSQREEDCLLLQSMSAKMDVQGQRVKVMKSEVTYLKTSSVTKELFLDVLSTRMVTSKEEMTKLLQEKSKRKLDGTANKKVKVARSLIANTTAIKTEMPASIAFHQPWFDIHNNWCSTKHLNGQTNEQTKEQTKEQTNEQTNEQINEQRNEQRNEQPNEQRKEQRNEQPNEQRKEQRNEQTNKQTNEQTNEQTNKQTNEQTNEQRNEQRNEQPNEQRNEQPN